MQKPDLFQNLMLSTSITRGLMRNSVERLMNCQRHATGSVLLLKSTLDAKIGKVDKAAVPGKPGTPSPAKMKMKDEDELGDDDLGVNTSDPLDDTAAASTPLEKLADLQPLVTPIHSRYAASQSPDAQELKEVRARGGVLYAFPEI